MAKIKELFGYSCADKKIDWKLIVKDQNCPFTGRHCIKKRKSEPEVAIGTCTIEYSRFPDGIVICPFRLIENNQIFIDCLHLLTGHVPGNEIHIVPEVSIPGGNVDYFLVSADSNKQISDFVGIELQAMDTTGTLWPERQVLLKGLGLVDSSIDVKNKSYGINWKMTAKTILVQLHHKIKTFEALNKHLVLVAQDCLLDYIKGEFSFSHISDYAKLNEAMHFHAYVLKEDAQSLKLTLSQRYSTNSDGVSKLLGLNTNPNVDLKAIIKSLESKMSEKTRLHLG